MSMPPPGQPPGFPPPSSPATPKLDIGAAVSYGFSKFGQNAGPLVLCTVIVFVAQAIAILAGAQLAGASGFVIRLLFTVVGLVLQRALVRAGLTVVNGRKPDVGQVFRMDNIGPYAVASLILGVIQAVVLGVLTMVFGLFGSLVGVVATAVINALFGFYGFVIVEQNVDGVTGLKRSMELTKPILGSVVLFFFVTGLIALGGAILCLIGLLAAIPITIVAQAHAYRQLSGGPIVP